MRLSLLVSLFLGILVLVTISKRLPFAAFSLEPTAEHVAQPLDTRSLPQAVAAPVSSSEPPGGRQPVKVAALARSPTAAQGGQPATQLQGRMYKWRDSNGSIRYQSDPPPSTVQAHVIPFTRKAAKQFDDVQSQALVFRASPAPSAARPLDGTAADLKGTLSDALSVYTPDGFDALVERVEKIAVQLHDRSQTIRLLEKQL